MAEGLVTREKPGFLYMAGGQVQTSSLIPVGRRTGKDAVPSRQRVIVLLMLMMEPHPQVICTHSISIFKEVNPRLQGSVAGPQRRL